MDMQFPPDAWPKKDREQQVMEMRLCEQNHVILKPDVLYHFTVDPSCGKCRQIAATCEPS
ncbi:hypothetical protein [Mesorhizobium sp. CN2-181]|uniref:hypothetical protein n=1 Tax=Mesorhizobium yinganensis TaxID=3157707 RepID=UPI0032B78B5C